MKISSASVQFVEFRNGVLLSRRLVHRSVVLVSYLTRECRSIRWIWGMIKLAYLSFWYLSRWKPFQKGILPFEWRLLRLNGRWYLYGRSEFHPSLIRFRPVGWAMCAKYTHTQTEQKMCRASEHTRTSHHIQMHTHLSGKQKGKKFKQQQEEKRRNKKRMLIFQFKVAKWIWEKRNRRQRNKVQGNIHSEVLDLVDRY